MGSILESWANASAWTRHQAAQVYTYDDALSYWKVTRRWHFAGYEPYIAAPVSKKLIDSFKHELTWHKNHPNLRHNLMLRDWLRLPMPVRKKIALFFEGNGLTDFDFFDHGGRAMVFLATDMNSGKRRIARMEADHHSRSIRPAHPSVLQSLHSNQDSLADYERIKLEILPEIVPIHKLPARDAQSSVPPMAKDFHEASYYLGHGSNLTYHGAMFDRDADPQNMGLLPDGRVVSLDPEFIFGDEAMQLYTYIKEQGAFSALAPYAGQLYGAEPEARFF